MAKLRCGPDLHAQNLWPVGSLGTCQSPRASAAASSQATSATGSARILVARSVMKSTSHDGSGDNGPRASSPANPRPNVTARSARIRPFGDGGGTRGGSHQDSLPRDRYALRRTIEAGVLGAETFCLTHLFNGVCSREVWELPPRTV
jgi:hypothetical protein